MSPSRLESELLESESEPEEQEEEPEEEEGEEEPPPAARPERCRSSMACAARTEHGNAER